MPSTKSKPRRRSDIPPKALHRHLHLQHHSHTGRLLHHRHTSYRGLAVLLVLAGICMVTLTLVARATAAELTVYARNPAPIPTDAAVITSPVDGANVSKSTLPVSGTCPVITPRVVIAILDNGTLAGSAACDSDNNFSLPIVIAPGRHTLVARVYTITDDAGPDSTPVTVTYTTPAPVSASGSSGAQSEQTGGQPLVVTIDEPFIVFGPAQDAIWTGTITGGTLPYHVHIRWGDGKSSTYTVAKSGEQNFAHHYTQMDSHVITLQVTDAAGRSVTHDYAAVTPYQPPVAAFTGTTKGRMPFEGSLPLGLYGAFLLLIAGFGALWLYAHRLGSFAYAKIPASRSLLGPRYAPRHRSTAHRRR